LSVSIVNSIALVNKSAPYGSANGQESLDLALAAASFGQNVSLFFIDDGVFQLLNEQHPEAIDAKNYSKTFAALEFYDIEHIYVCEHSLNERTIDLKELCIEVQVLKPEKLQEMLTKHKHIVSF
jgi:tRNA 2-thiouridine synthesizing protein C